MVDGNGLRAAARFQCREEQMRTSTHPRVLVTGAGGFIGHHLVTSLKQWGYWVRGADTSLPEYTGGMGFTSANQATILRNNALINIHTLEAARVNGVSRYLFSSSACIYPNHLQGVRGRNSDNRRLRLVLGWEPSVPLRQGLEPTYRWIEKQVTSRRPPWAAAGR
jgi:nucleoside-diphosphate-sugar epimerase